MAQIAVTQEPLQTEKQEEPKPSKKTESVNEAIVNIFRSIKDDAGQIVELANEEKTLVSEFFSQFLRLTAPLMASIPISTKALLDTKGEATQANMDPTGRIAIIYSNGNVELKDLKTEQNRDLMLSVIEDVVPKIAQLIKTQKQKIEKRIDYLSSVTKEMQDVSEALNSNIEQKSP